MGGLQSETDDARNLYEKALLGLAEEADPPSLLLLKKAEEKFEAVRP